MFTMSELSFKKKKFFAFYITQNIIHITYILSAPVQPEKDNINSVLQLKLYISPIFSPFIEL